MDEHGQASSDEPTDAVPVESDPHREFWRRTWAMWRSGVLAGPMPGTVEVSKVPFEEFLEGGDVKHPASSWILRHVPPRPTEFLIAFDVTEDERPYFILTSERLAVRTPKSPYTIFELRDIAAFRDEGWWTKTYFLTTSEGMQTFKKMGAVPQDAVLELAIANVRETPPWGGRVEALPPEGSEPLPSMEATDSTSTSTSATAAPVIAEPQADQAELFALEVWAPSGETHVYKSLDELERAVGRGAVRRDHRARWATAALPEGEDDEASWQTISEISKDRPEVAALFRPLSKAIGTGVLYGLYAGVALKALDTTIMMFNVDDRAGVLWLATLAAIGLTGRGGLGFWPIGILLFMTFKLGIRANFFMTAMAAGIVGAIFGIPAGSAIGTVIGHFKARSAAKIVDVESEGAKPYLLGFVLPVVFLACAVPFYIFWLTPKMMEWAMD